MENEGKPRRKRAVVSLLAVLAAALAAFGVLPERLVAPVAEVAGIVVGNL